MKRRAQIWVGTVIAATMSMFGCYADDESVLDKTVSPEEETATSDEEEPILLDDEEQAQVERVFSKTRLDSLNHPIEDNQLAVTFVINHGFLFGTSEHGILVDGVITPTDEEVPLTDALALMMENRVPPFDMMDLLLVSHAHADHYSREKMIDLLSANSALALLATKEVVATLEDTDLDNVIKGVHPFKNNTKTETAAGIEIEAVGIDHHNTDIEHMSFIFELNGIKVLHLGDAGKILSDYQTLSLQEEKIDILIAPFGSDCSNWMVAENGENLEIVKELIKPKFIIMGHVPIEYSAKETTQMYDDVTEAFPAMEVFMMHPDYLSQLVFTKEDGTVRVDVTQ